MYLGIDIGSSSSKAAILNENKEVVAIAVENMGTGTDAYQNVIKTAVNQVKSSMDDIDYTVVTGYGRMTFGTADKQVTEITCHAKGVNFLMDGVRTVIDIGGQDAKVIRLSKNGQVENFVMNEKCAAGTGRFLEVMARVLGCHIDELAGLAKQSTKEVSISNVCTVFAESEVISRLAVGEKIDDVARGVHVSIAKRVAGMGGRVGYEPQIVMTGGVALNEDVVRALSDEIGYDIEVVPHCQSVGAIGAAVIGFELKNKEG